MPFTPKLTYKGKPLVRKDNELYYGRMTDPYVLRMQILSTKSVGGMDVADKVHIQVFSTNDSLAPEAPCSARPPRMACTTHWTLAASGCRRQTRPAERHKKGPSPAEETVLFVVLYSSVTSKSRGLPQPGHLGAPSSRSSSSNTVV